LGAQKPLKFLKAGQRVLPRGANLYQKVDIFNFWGRVRVHSKAIAGGFFFTTGSTAIAALQQNGSPFPHFVHIPTGIPHLFPPFLFGRICFVVMVMTKGGESS